VKLGHFRANQIGALAAFRTKLDHARVKSGHLRDGGKMSPASLPATSAVESLAESDAP